jgi:hypothetical protein
VSDESWQRCLVDAVTVAQAALVAEARARQICVRELATTLILVVATPEQVAMVQIGDGAVVMQDEAGKLVALTVLQSGEYANETTFLTSPNALATAQLCLWHGTPRAVVAFSDGLQRLALTMPDGQPHAPFFAPFFRLLDIETQAPAAQAQIEAFLGSQRVRERTNDDVTLVLGSLMRSDCHAGTTAL